MVLAKRDGSIESLPTKAREVLREILFAALRSDTLQVTVRDRFNMFELEHNLCEFDKYCRVVSGESKGKKFEPRSVDAGNDRADPSHDGAV